MKFNAYQTFGFFEEQLLPDGLLESWATVNGFFLLKIEQIHFIPLEKLVRAKIG